MLCKIKSSKCAMGICKQFDLCAIHTKSERLNIGPQGVSCKLRWHLVCTYSIQRVCCETCVSVFRELLWGVCSLPERVVSEKVIKCLWLWQIGTGSSRRNSEHESLGMIHTGTDMMMHFILYSRFIAVDRQPQVFTGALPVGNYFCNLTQAWERARRKIRPHYCRTGENRWRLVYVSLHHHITSAQKGNNKWYLWVHITTQSPSVANKSFKLVFNYDGFDFFNSVLEIE